MRHFLPSDMLCNHTNAHTHQSASPINRPPVCLQELGAGLFKGKIGSELFGFQRLTSQRIRFGSSEVFEYGGSIIGLTVFRHYRVVHDGKRYVVNQIVRYFLYDESQEPSINVASVNALTRRCKCSGSAMAKILLNSSTFRLIDNCISTFSSKPST